MVALTAIAVHDHGGPAKSFPAGDISLTPRTVICGFTCGVMIMKEVRFPINPILSTKGGKRTFLLFARIAPSGSSVTIQILSVYGGGPRCAPGAGRHRGTHAAGQAGRRAGEPAGAGRRRRGH